MAYKGNFTIHIEALNKSTTKGTFSGVLKNDENVLMSITDGEFFVKVYYSETDN